MPQKIRIAVVIGIFHKAIAKAMLEKIRQKVKELNAELIEVMEIPGSYEAPLAAKRLLEREDVDCIAVTGFIEKGETLHGEHIGLVVSRLLKELELHYNKPVGMGIIGPGATKQQAKRRLDYGSAAVEAAINMVNILKKK